MRRSGSWDTSGDEPFGFEMDNTPSHGANDFEIVSRDDDGSPPGVDIRENIHDPLGGLRIQPSGGFIRKEDDGLFDKGPCTTCMLFILGTVHQRSCCIF